MRSFLLALAGIVVGVLAVLAPARAATIAVDLSSQTMHVYSGSGDYVWPISSARSGYVTPRGTFGVQRLEVMHRSHKYHNSPMPHSIFFHGGYAIHGTYAVGSLGAPASHGCIRISPGNAAVLYDIVRAEGASISIMGSSGGARYARAESRHRHADRAVARRRTAEPALGYAAQPRMAPSFDDWMRAPAGYGQPSGDFGF